MKLNIGGVLALALIGAVVAAFCDGVHVHTGTLSYPDPSWFGQAFWVPPLFFVTFVSMALVYTALAHGPGARMNCRLSATPSATPAAFVECMTLFLLAYLLSGFGNRDPLLLSIVFYGSFLIRLAVSYERGFLLLVAALMAVGGVVGEGLLNRFGLVQYRAPEIFGVPFWLGGLYMHGAFALREGVRYFCFGEPAGNPKAIAAG